MNTLQQLNNYSTGDFEFTDNRPAGVIFDRVTPTNQTVTTTQNTTHTMPVGIEIEEIINYSTAAVTLTVTVSAAAGATVTWPTVPAGCTVTNPSTGVYIISGINKVATWDIVKTPTVLSPTGINNDIWQYSATVTYNGTTTKTWYVAVFVGTVTVLTTPSAYVYTAGAANAVTGYPQIQYPGSTPTWTMTVTPELAAGITTMSSAGSGGTSTFNSTTKVLTIVGTKTQVNSHLAALTVTTTTDKQWSYNLTYYASNDTDIVTATQTQAWSNTNYAILSVTRAADTYTINTDSVISGGPLIADTTGGTDNYTLTVIPTDTASILELDTTHAEDIIRVTSSDPAVLSTGFGRTVAYSGNGSYWAVGCPDSGCVYVYTGTNTLMARLSTGTVYFGGNIALNQAGDTLAVSSYFVDNNDGSSASNETAIYVRTNSEWSLQHTITLTDHSGSVDLSDDGNILIIGRRELTNPSLSTSTGGVLVYTRAGTTWTYRTAIFASDGQFNDRFGHSVSISGDGTYIAVGSYRDTNSNGSLAGSVYIYTGSGSSWTEQTRLQAGTGGSTGDYYGRSVSLDVNGDTLAVGSYRDTQGSVYIVTRSGTTWTEQTNFTVSGLISFDDFGATVSMNAAGTRLAVGAPGTGTNRGTVYIYTGSGSSWSLANTLTASDAADNDRFGWQVSITDSTTDTIVGSYGAAAIYKYAVAVETIVSPPVVNDQISDQFGYQTCIDSTGTYMAVSARNRDSLSTVSNVGAVYIFVRTNTIWTLQTTLFASVPEQNALFGSSLSFNSDATYLAVGSSNDDSPATNAGVVYIFTRTGTTWAQQTIIQASDAAASDNFGYAVNLNNDASYLAVSSYNDNNSGGTDAGSVYIYTRSGTTWTEQTRLQASDAAASDNFGYSLSLNSAADYLAIGSYIDDNSGGSNAGSVYIFTRSGTTWTEQTRLQASDATANDQFGYSVSLNSNATSIAIGAPLDDTTGGSNTGSVYVFTRSGSTWTQSTRLQSDDATASDQFGNQVQINNDGNIIFAAAWIDNSSTGSVYAFIKSGGMWTQARKITASDSATGDNFGNSLALSSDGNILVVGSYGEDTVASQAGSAYVYYTSDLFSSWNVETKTLTITATKNYINGAIDLLNLTPTTGYDKNYQLLYTVTIPSGSTASRSQRITRA